MKVRRALVCCEMAERRDKYTLGRLQLEWSGRSPPAGDKQSLDGDSLQDQKDSQYQQSSSVGTAGS